MKTVKLIAALCLLSLSSLVATAQKMDQESGDLKMLVGQTKMLVEYDFSKLVVGKEGSEEVYLKAKQDKMNEKEPGKGDKFVEGWHNNKTERYEPKFEELFNKEGDGKIQISQNNKNAKYKLIVKTLTLYPGYNVGISKMPAYVSFAFEIVEVADSTKLLSRTVIRNVMGSQVMGYDFDAGSRLQESYAKAGKMFSKYIIKKAPLK